MTNLLAANEVLSVPFDKFKEMMAIDVNSLTETRLGLSYLPWAEAYILFKEHFPTLRIIFDLEEVKRDELVYTAVLVRLWCLEKNQYTLAEYFPVMGIGKQRLAEPNCTTRDISDSIKRASVKVIALETGIGYNLYRKEKDDLPEEKLERSTFQKANYGESMTTRDVPLNHQPSTFKKLI